MNETNSSTIAIAPKLPAAFEMERIGAPGRLCGGRTAMDLNRGSARSDFRADAFIKTIYRKLARQPAIGRKIT